MLHTITRPTLLHATPRTAVLHRSLLLTMLTTAFALGISMPGVILLRNGQSRHHHCQTKSQQALT
ncbi:MAG: hypothetical protein PsegKO_22430 [Pseudohongiellaceae bacterium]